MIRLGYLWTWIFTIFYVHTKLSLKKARIFRIWHKIIICKKKVDEGYVFLVLLFILFYFFDRKMFDKMFSFSFVSIFDRGKRNPFLKMWIWNWLLLPLSITFLQIPALSEVLEDFNSREISAMKMFDIFIDRMVNSVKRPNLNWWMSVFQPQPIEV